MIHIEFLSNKDMICFLIYFFPRFFKSSIDQIDFFFQMKTTTKKKGNKYLTF